MSVPAALALLTLVACNRSYPNSSPWGLLLLEDAAGGTTTETAPDYSTVILGEGESLLAYWRLNETSNPVNDTKGSNAGTLQNAGTVTNEPSSATVDNDGDSGVCLSDAGTNYIEFPHNNDLEFTTGQSLTLEAWVKPLSLNDKMTLITKGRTTGSDNGNYTIRIAGSRVGFFFGDNGSANVAAYRTNDFVLRTGEWYHIVLTHTYGSTANTAFYINGELQTGSWIVGAGTETPDSAAENIWVGASNGPAAGAVDNVIDGCIDEVAIYNSVLSEANIQDHYRSGRNKVVGFSTAYAITGASDVKAMEVSGGVQPYTYSITSGSGTVDSSGNFTAPASMGSTTIQVSDSRGYSDSVTIRHYIEPDDVAGLLAWYRADDLTYADTTGVSSFTDLSGNGNHGTQGTAGSQPTFNEGVAQGRPVVTFDGNDELDLGAGLARDPVNVANPHTTIAFFSSTVNPRVILGQNPTQGLIAHRNGCTFTADYLTTGNVCPSTAYTGNPVLHSVANTTTTVQYYKNGVDDGGPSPTGLTTNGTNWFMGSANGGFYLNGQVGEILIYNSVLSDTDRQNIECYMAERYDTSLASSLASTHGCP